jgi:hypothetical protein
MAMSWNEFIEALRDLDISQRDFASLIAAASPVTEKAIMVKAAAVNKWKRKPMSIPPHAEAILRLMLAMRRRDAEWAADEISALLPKARKSKAAATGDGQIEEAVQNRTHPLPIAETMKLFES